MLLQGGVALLGAQAAKSLVSKISHQERSRAGSNMFRIGTSKAKKRWSLGQFLRRI